jgi:hypothetical protein
MDREDYYKLSERLGRMELSALKVQRVVRRCGALAIFCISFGAAWWAQHFAAAYTGFAGVSFTFLVVLLGGNILLHRLILK